MVYGERVERTSESGLAVRVARFLERWTFRCAHICVVPTPSLSQWIQDNYAIALRKIRVIPNFVDTELFRPREVTPDNQILLKDIVVVARLDKGKRHRLLLEAASGHGLKIRFIGQGSLAEELTRYAREHGIDLEWLPSVPHSKLPDFLTSTKIFILLSEWEGHPKALIEAMACGLPCIGADSPGINTILIHGKNGLVIKPEVPALIDAVETLLQNNELRHRLGSAARQFVCQHYSLQSIVEAYTKVFDEVLTDSPGRNREITG